MCALEKFLLRNALARFNNFTFDLRYACTRLSAYFIFHLFEWVFDAKNNKLWMNQMNEKNRVENPESNRFAVVISEWCSSLSLWWSLSVIKSFKLLILLMSFLFLFQRQRTFATLHWMLGALIFINYKTLLFSPIQWIELTWFNFR